MISIESSIKNCIAPVLFSDYSERLGMDLSHNQDILEQIYFVLIGIQPSEEILIKNTLEVYKTHYLASDLVIISHVLDDYFDEYDNNKHYFEELYQILQAINLKSNFEEVFSKIIELLILNGLTLSVTQQILNITNSMGPAIKDIYFKSNLRMAISGVVQTINTWSIENNIPHEKVVEIQKNLMQIYIDLHQSLFHKELQEEVSKNSVTPYEVLISLASSLQEMFLVEQDSVQDLEQVELYNCLLGPLVFLNNYKKEKVRNNIVFFDVERDANLQEYSDFINFYWSKLKNLPPINSRIIQLKKAIEYTLKSENQNFQNFPAGLVELKSIYKNIYYDIIEMKL